MSQLSDEIAKGPGGAGLPWAETEMTKVGDTVTGTVIDADFRQSFNPETKQPAVWEKSGEPIMEVVIKVSGTGKFRPDLEDGDNGDRAFHIRWAFENKDAFIEAMNLAGAAEPLPGGKFAARLVALRQNGGVRKPTKLFTYEYIAPPSDLAQALTEQPETAPPPAASLLTQPAPTAPATPTVAAPVTATVAAPVAAAGPVTPATDPVALLATIQTLIGMGMTDQQITGATGADPAALIAIRQIPVRA